MDNLLDCHLKKIFPNHFRGKLCNVLLQSHVSGNLSLQEFHDLTIWVTCFNCIHQLVGHVALNYLYLCLLLENFENLRLIENFVSPHENPVSETLESALFLGNSHKHSLSSKLLENCLGNS